MVIVHSPDIKLVFYTKNDGPVVVIQKWSSILRALHFLP